MTAADPHLDTGAYALHALPEDEAELAQSHFDTCESCSAELIGFLETAALLGSVAAEGPPASLRRSIMTRIAQTPQLPPLTGRTPRHAAPEPPETTTPSPADEQPPTAPPGAGLPDSGGPPTAPGDTVGNVVPLRPWYRRPAALVAAAVAVVVIGGGTVVAVNQLTGHQEQTAQTPEQCVAQAADAKNLTPAKGQGTLTYSQACDAALLDVTGLPGLPDNQTYQLWALAGTTPRSLGLLPDASAGKPQVVTAQPHAGETVVAITAEPAGGSTQPTMPILWQASLTS